jgi:CHAT domain-containing protein
VRRLSFVLVLIVASCADRRQSFEGLLSSGYLEFRRGDLQAARARAEEGRRLAGGKGDAAWAWRFQVLHAEVLAAEGRRAEALVLLDTQPRSKGPLDPADVRALVTRAYVLCVSARGAESFRRAEADLEEASRLAATLRSAELSAEVTLRSGTCASNQGDGPSAESRFREALAAAHREDRPFLEALATSSLGLLNVRKGRYDEGADWLEKALELASAAEAHLVLARTLLNLGWCYFELGDYDRALTFLSRAAAHAETRGQTGDRQTALQNMGNAHYRLGDLASAADHYRRALALARDLDDPKAVAQLLSNLGIVALEQERYDEAETAIREALVIKAKIDDRPGRQNSLLAEGQIWAGRGEHAKAEARYREVIGSPDAEQVALWETHASLARLYVKTHRATEAEGEFRKAFAVMERFRGELRKMEHKISFFSSLGQFYDSYVDFLVEGGRADEALTVADASRALLLRERLGTGRRLPPVGTERIRQAARALDAVILCYWMAPHRSFLWVVTPGKIEIHALPDEAVIRKHVETHQERIARSRDPLAEAAPDAEWLYRNLVEPAQASIPRGSRVVFVADGPLHQINPETLVVPRPQPHYFLEDVILTAAPSLVLLAQGAQGVPRPTSGLLLIGDAVSPSEEFPALPHAAKEVVGIAEQFLPAERSVYSGAKADPTVYETADPGRYTYIHFAAHAQANREIPLESAVILSPRNDSYKLYARDIVGIPLRADLVTLSACRSAGSRTYAGEGLVGLAWAFLSAGAANVVAGLWNVEDSSTAELMKELYRGLKQGRDPAESLRAAKLGLLRSETDQRKPYYWAPFMTYAARRGRPPSLAPAPHPPCRGGPASRRPPRHVRGRG